MNELTPFLSALFTPTDLVEIRGIETWTDGKKKVSRPVARVWLQPHEIIERFTELRELNQTANIFFGVNPRIDRRGKKDSVAECRFVWADLDNVTPEEAEGRFQKIGPRPTIVVQSGHGVHAYWQLVNPVSVSEQRSRSKFESLVKQFAGELGGDTTQDVTRLLRLPETLNVKNVRGGARPVPCQLLSLRLERVYPMAAFSKWESQAEREVNVDAIRDAPIAKVAAPFGSASLGTSRDARRIQGLVRYLDRDVEDRSRRDFWVVLNLLAHMAPDEVASLVEGKGKFLEGGEPYLQKTIENALRHLGR